MSKKMALALLLALLIGYAGSYFIPPSETISRLANITNIDIPNFRPIQRLHQRENTTIITSTTTPNITQVATLTNTTTNKTTNTKTSTSTTTTKRVDESSVINRTELTLYALDLINIDRLDSDVEPVELGTLSTAQDHADDLASMCVLSHWDSGGMKPYMRYSLAGGVGVVSENAAIQLWSIPIIMSDSIIKEAIIDLEYQMMYKDAASNWGHRDTIIDPFHNKVHVGISWSSECVVYIQHFEKDYIEWIENPEIGPTYLLKLSGIIHYPLTETGPIVRTPRFGGVGYVYIAYDPLPEPLSATLLSLKPNFYRLGETVGTILPPLGEGYRYIDLEETDIVAPKWNEITDRTDATTQFEIEVSIKPIIDTHGKGVYTIYFFTVNFGRSIQIAEISIFVE